jgi:hypothetical protein
MSKRFGQFISRWTAAEPEPKRWSGAWWKHHALVFVVFGVTGSSAMWLVRPQLFKAMGVQGDPTTGERLASLFLMMPFYYAILLIVGTCFGKHAYVKNMAMRPLKYFSKKKATQKLD